MKRLLIASALLAALLAGTAANAQFIDGLTDDLSLRLEQAQELVREDRWEEALSHTLEARRLWQDHTLYLYVVTRHGDADRICRGFETALELLERRSTAEYAHVNTDLMVQLELLAEAEQPTLANIL